jgi:Arc/MetJ-type ribon-helix-helix transcriptional regulator
VVRTLSVRLDDQAQRALAELQHDGLNASHAVRAALVAEARRRRGQAIRTQVARLAADEDDRREKATILEDMGEQW